MSSTTVTENTKDPVEERSVIVIEDDSETEGQVSRMAQESPRGSMSSINGLANGISTSRLDVDPPRTPTTTGGELPTSASTSPTPRQSMAANISLDPNGDIIMSQDPQKAKATTSGPKHTKAKEDSPVPQLPPRPPQQPTVRLEFFIDDPEEYEVNILQLAKGAGQRLPTPPPPEKDSSDSEDDEDPPEQQPPIPLPEATADTPAAPFRKRKRRNKDYDLDDPFIDDEDLAIDERTHIAQTTLQGFYVSAGDVDLVAQSSPPPASKRGPGRPPKRAAGPVNATLIARTLLSNPLGNHRLEGLTAQAAITASLELGMTGKDASSPILEFQELDIGNSNGNDRKRKASPESNDPKKKRKTADIPFHPELEDALASLQKAISKHDFTYKGKFPPDLKPLLLDTAVKAICLGDYNENFFNYLPKIFPYNRFTMLKLTKRLVYKEHIRLIHERQATLLEELSKQVNEGMDTAKAEHERNVMLWEEKRAKKKADETLNKQGNGMEGVEPTSLPPPVAPVLDEHKDHGGEGEGEDGEDDKDKPPTTRYRLNETMRGYLWALVQLSNEVCTFTNEKNHLEGSKEVVSEQSQRKELYKKIMQAFPDGWMNTGTISREVSMMKKKMETATGPKNEEVTVPGTAAAAAATAPVPVPAVPAPS